MTSLELETERALSAFARSQIPADHILSLQCEQFERDLAQVLVGDRQRKGMRVILSNLSGEGLRASLRTTAMYGRVVQLNSSDPAQGQHMGTDSVCWRVCRFSRPCLRMT